MKNVVIISGHPDLKVSVANKTILEEISAKCPQVEIRKLDELYPDYNFDVKAEQAAQCAFLALPLKSKNRHLLINAKSKLIISSNALAVCKILVV